jgi:glucose/arabinose dehydrogenase
LGIAFVPDSWPAPWRGRLLVAYQNSIVWFDVDELGHVSASGDFITMKRPADLKFDANGALYITDDTNGIIYRVVQTS